MKLREIRNMEKSAVNEKIMEMKKELVKMNAQVAIGTALKNPGQIKQIKKTIAKMLSIQNEPKKKAIIKKSTIKKQEVGKKA